MPPFNRRQRGAKAERLAERFLKRAGLRPIARNVSYRFGELDLVMLDQAEDTLVVVEVRHKAHATHERIADSIGYAKQRRVCMATEAYLAAHPEHETRACRIDVVTIAGSLAQCDLQWIQDAFYINDHG